MHSFNPAIGLPGLLTDTVTWLQISILLFQSRNRASRPSDLTLIGAGAYLTFTSFNPAIGLPGLLTASANLWHQWFYLEFQSRNRASRPSDHELLNMQWNLTVFQSRNRASRPSDLSELNSP